MADLNWSLTGTESENLIQYNYTEGVIANINDNDANTNRYVQSGAAGGGLLYVEFEHEIAFVETVNTINKIEVVSATGGFSGLAGILDFKVYLYYSSTWNLVYTGSTGLWEKKTDSQLGTWNNVSKIKLYLKGSANNAPDRPRHVGLYHYELRAWGPLNYTDIGLRVRTSSGTIKIGTESLDGHALRIRKGGTTYGIPLISTGDASACGFRIYDGSAVKSVPEVS